MKTNDNSEYSKTSLVQPQMSEKVNPVRIKPEKVIFTLWGSSFNNVDADHYEWDSEDFGDIDDHDDDIDADTDMN